MTGDTTYRFGTIDSTSNAKAVRITVAGLTDDQVAVLRRRMTKLYADVITSPAGEDAIQDTPLPDPGMKIGPESCSWAINPPNLQRRAP
jgi:hypothetical protein